MWWVSRVHIIKDELLLGLITLLLWWGEGEGDFACHNYIKKAILTFNNFRFCLFNFYKEQNPIVFYYLIDHLFQLTSFLHWRNDFHSHTDQSPLRVVTRKYLHKWYTKVSLYTSKYKTHFIYRQSYFRSPKLITTSVADRLIYTLY